MRQPERPQSVVIAPLQVVQRDDRIGCHVVGRCCRDGLEVRGLLSELRREHTEGADGIDSLRCYLGLVPMQLWLVERLEQRLAAHNTDQTPLQPLEEPALEPQDIEVFPFRQPGAVIG